LGVAPGETDWIQPAAEEFGSEVGFLLDPSIFLHLVNRVSRPLTLKKVPHLTPQDGVEELPLRQGEAQTLPRKSLQSRNSLDAASTENWLTAIRFNSLVLDNNKLLEGQLPNNASLLSQLCVDRLLSSITR